MRGSSPADQPARLQFSRGLSTQADLTQRTLNRYLSSLMHNFLNTRDEGLRNKLLCHYHARCAETMRLFDYRKSRDFDLGIDQRAGRSMQGS